MSGGNVILGCIVSGFFGGESLGGLGSRRGGFLMFGPGGWGEGRCWASS